VDDRNGNKRTYGGDGRRNPGHDRCLSAPDIRRGILLDLSLEIHDQDLAVTAARVLLGGVREFYPANMEAIEQGADFGYVVQGQDEFALDAFQTPREFPEVSLFEVIAIEFPPVVGRVEKEERRRPVVIAKDGVVREAVDLDPFQSLMRIFNELGEAFRVEPRWLDDVPMVDGMADEARERILQEIQIPGGPLDVGERRGIGRSNQVEVFAAHEREAQIPQQLFVMGLADAEEIHDLAVKIVQDLNLRRRLVKKYLCAACESFDVRRVLRK
jgi:hypothetical protein